MIPNQGNGLQLDRKLSLVLSCHVLSSLTSAFCQLLSFKYLNLRCRESFIHVFVKEIISLCSEAVDPSVPHISPWDPAAHIPRSCHDDIYSTAALESKYIAFQSKYGAADCCGTIFEFRSYAPIRPSAISLLGACSIGEL